MPDALTALITLAEDALARREGLVVLGLSGAQGSGKSTLATALARHFDAAILSLDDLYLTRAERQALAATVHPLFATRGVPGTHDVALGLAAIDALARGEAAPLPRFDKAIDDRAATPAQAPAGTRLLIFEGWCLGARPEPEANLATPINALEAEADPQAIWRRHVNAALAGAYQDLWARIDVLAMLRAPDFSTVVRWRQQQEHALRGPAAMDDAQVVRFVAHYERITRRLLADLPDRADLVMELDPARCVMDIAIGVNRSCA
jgi:D-glycerate 3-kinase